MTETKNIVETILKMKALSYFLIFWGATFFIRGIVDIVYYMYHFGAVDFTETLAETSTWILYDVFSIVAAAALWAVAIKLLQSRNK
jgi:flagellar biosynthesis protein FliR